MLLELIADRNGNALLQPYEESAIRPDQVRLKSLYSAIKHGTEFRTFQANTPDATSRWDPELRLHIRGEERKGMFPMALGNSCVGIVTDLGSNVSNLKVGDRVFGHLPVRTTHTVSAERVKLVTSNISPQALMYADPTEFALGGVRDAPVRLGDRVAIYGLGAIGQMAVQVARLAGARWVAAVDPIEKRRDAAAKHGADLVLDPTTEDTGLVVKKQTGGLGVDVAMETSGAFGALNDTLRSTKYRGTVVSTAYYNWPSQALSLAGEWHRNRIRIISSRANSEPHPDYGWDFSRIKSEALTLIEEGKLIVDDLMDPVVSMDQVADAYLEMNEHPERGIKLGIDHCSYGSTG